RAGRLRHRGRRLSARCGRPDRVRGGAPAPGGGERPGPCGVRRPRLRCARGVRASAARKRLADLEAAQPFGLLFVDLGPFHLGPRRSRLQEPGHAVDGIGRALEDRFHRTLGRVAYPSGHAVRSRALTSRVSEEDTLDVSVGGHLAANYVFGHRRNSSKRAWSANSFPSAARAMLIGPMTALWLLIGLCAGAALVAAALRPRLRSLVTEAAHTHELEQELVRARSELGHERERAEERLATVKDAQERLSDS